MVSATTPSPKLVIMLQAGTAWHMQLPTLIRALLQDALTQIIHCASQEGELRVAELPSLPSGWIAIPDSMDTVYCATDLFKHGWVDQELN